MKYAKIFNKIFFQKFIFLFVDLPFFEKFISISFPVGVRQCDRARCERGHETNVPLHARLGGIPGTSAGTPRGGTTARVLPRMVPSVPTGVRGNRFAPVDMPTMRLVLVTGWKLMMRNFKKNLKRIELLGKGIKI